MVGIDVLLALQKHALKTGLLNIQGALPREGTCVHAVSLKVQLAYH